MMNLKLLVLQNLMIILEYTSVIKIEISDESGLDDTLSADEYKSLISE